MSNQIQLLAHSLAARIQAMAQDCPLNNSRVIEEEIREVMASDLAKFEKAFEDRSKLELEHIEALAKELESAKKQAAAMRDAIMVARDSIAVAINPELMGKLDAAVFDLGIGRNYISRERVKPIVEFAWDLFKNHDHDTDAHRYGTPCYVCDAEKMVAHARKLGLLDCYDANENRAQMP